MFMQIHNKPELQLTIPVVGIIKFHLLEFFLQLWNIWNIWLEKYYNQADTEQYHCNDN